MTEPKVSVVCEGRIDTALIPDYVGHNIAQVAFRSILEAWENPDIQERYRRWKAARKDGNPDYPGRESRHRQQGGDSNGTDTNAVGYPPLGTARGAQLYQALFPQVEQAGVGGGKRTRQGR